MNESHDCHPYVQKFRMFACVDTLVSICMSKAEVRSIDVAERKIRHREKVSERKGAISVPETIFLFKRSNSLCELSDESSLRIPDNPYKE